MKSKVIKELYIPKCEIEEFRGKIERLMIKLSGSKKVEFSTDLITYQDEEVIVFNAVCYGDSEEEVKQEYEKFKALIHTCFGEEPKEME